MTSQPQTGLTPAPARAWAALPAPVRFAAAAILLVCALWARLRFVVILPFDTDEPQHLHVVWAWANGLLPYRDVFDNHTPVFQLICSPLFALLGERADILIPMRVAMLVPYFVCLWVTYRLGSLLFSKRAGVWAALISGCYPTVYVVATEFRPDDLWAAVWLLAVLTVAGGMLRPMRLFAFGLFMGLSFGVSMKTTLLLASVMLAALILTAFRMLAGDSIPWKLYAGRALIVLSGLCVVPTLLIAFFHSQGALKEFYYGAIQHNLLSRLGNWHESRWRLAWFFAGVPALTMASHRIRATASDQFVGERRAFILLIAGIFVTALHSFWPLITRQDYLPVIPLLALMASPLLLIAANRVRAGELLLAVLLTVELGVAYKAHPWKRNDTKAPIQGLAMILRLTKPDEFVMDAKGETIFRNRPFFWVLEDITRARLRQGLIHDDIPQRLIDTQTCVVSTNRMPGQDRVFVRANYLPYHGDYFVAGVLCGPLEPNRPVSFSLAIPAEYAVRAEGGFTGGLLDSVPYVGARHLAAGNHVFSCAEGHGRLAVFWARAAGRDFPSFISRTAPDAGSEP